MTDALPYAVREPVGEAVPLLLSIPHCGSEVPEEISRRFASETIAALPDTDFHLDKLYDFAPQLGVRTVYARYSRYVVDLNRPADQSPLYPGRDETGLVPLSSFASMPIYRAGEEPTAEEIQTRIETYWQPYHQRLARELDELRGRHGYALLFDAHSIRSRVARLFAGELPGLMLGDVDATSAAPVLSAAVLSVHAESGFSYRANDPFRGGYITRSYGRPNQGIHALQLEMSQRLYMDEDPPYLYRAELAQRIRPVLRACLLAMIAAGSI